MTTRAERGTAKLKPYRRPAELRARCQYCRRVFGGLCLEGAPGVGEWVELAGPPPANVHLTQPWASFSIARRSLRWRHICNGRQMRTVQHQCDELVPAFKSARRAGTDLYL